MTLKQVVLLTHACTTHSPILAFSGIPMTHKSQIAFNNSCLYEEDLYRWQRITQQFQQKCRVLCLDANKLYLHHCWFHVSQQAKQTSVAFQKTHTPKLFPRDLIHSPNSCLFRPPPAFVRLSMSTVLFTLEGEIERKLRVDKENFLKRRRNMAPQTSTLWLYNTHAPRRNTCCLLKNSFKYIYTSTLTHLIFSHMFLAAATCVMCFVDEKYCWMMLK